MSNDKYPSPSDHVVGSDEPIGYMETEGLRALVNEVNARITAKDSEISLELIFPTPQASQIVAANLDQMALDAVDAIFNRMLASNLRLASGASNALPGSLSEGQIGKVKAVLQVICRDALALATRGSRVPNHGASIKQAVGECLAGMPHTEVSQETRRKIENAIDSVSVARGEKK